MNSLANLPTERQCHKQLFKLTYGSCKCPICEHKLLYRSNYAWCSHCRVKHSIKAATWLKHCNLSFQKIWLLIWCWQHHETVGGICRIVSISYPTAHRWLIRFRQILPDSSLKLSGIVEVDESFFGKQRYQREQREVSPLQVLHCINLVVIKFVLDLSQFITLIFVLRYEFGVFVS